MRTLERVTRAPALVFDPRDWYAETFLSPGQVRRPGGPVRVLLAPGAVPAPDLSGWPFLGEAELVLVTSPVGFVAFFDQARGLTRGASVADTPTAFGPQRRGELRAGQYRGRMACAGFQDANFDVTVPADHPQRIDLLPGPTYPFPVGRRANGLAGPTLIRGTVVTTEGVGTPGVTVTVPARPLVQPCQTDAKGSWVLVLDRYNPSFPAPAAPANNPLIPPQPGPIDLAFGFPGQPAPVLVTGFEFVPGQETSFPLTSLRGTVRDRSGQPVAGVVIQVAGQPGASRSGPDGNWVYCFPLSGPRTGQTRVAVTATAPDGRPASATVDLRYGELLRVAPLIV